MLGSQFFNCSVFFLLDQFDLLSTFVLHFLSKIKHLLLELSMDLIGDSFKLMSLLGLSLVFLFSQGVEILFMSLLLFFLTDSDRSQILFQLSLVDSIFIFNVLKSHLSFFLQLSQLIQILED